MVFFHLNVKTLILFLQMIYLNWHISMHYFHTYKTNGIIINDFYYFCVLMIYVCRIEIGRQKKKINYCFELKKCSACLTNT